MSNVIDMPGNALHEWREIEPIRGVPHPALREWIRIPCGWTDEDSQQAIQISVGTAADATPFVTVKPERQLIRGPNKGKWVEGRGDIHSREEFLSLLGAVVSAGQKAGWL